MTNLKTCFYKVVGFFFFKVSSMGFFLQLKNSTLRKLSRKLKVDNQTGGTGAELLGENQHECKYLLISDNINGCCYEITTSFLVRVVQLKNESYIYIPSI